MSTLQFITLLGPAVGSLVLVLLAWMQSNSRLADLKDAMNQRFSAVDRQFERMDARLVRIENDQREFYGITRKLEGRIDELSKR